MNRSKSLLILIPFFVGGIQTAKSDVIPANTRLEHENITGVSVNSDFATFSQDFNCSTSNKFYTGANANGAVWACIEALSDSVGSSSGSASSGVTPKNGSENTNVIGDATRNVLEVGTGTNPTQIHQSGMSVNGQNLISRDANGVTKIGANSLNFQTKNGTENLWGTDASGNPIPLNITNGSKLLIDGRDVEQAIDNVGALTAALTGLPIVPEDSKLSCGLGTGAHGGNVAVSGGCASKVNERLTMNLAGSLIPTGQDYLGDTENAWSGRAGFLFKLGKIDKPTQISMKDKKAMQAKITDLSTANKELQAKVESFQFANQEMKASNQELRNLLAMQNERLEKIEQIALANQKDEKTAFSFLNVSNLFSSISSFLISSN